MSVDRNRPAPTSADHGRDVENLIGDLEFAVADRERIDHEIMKLKRASDVAIERVKDVRRRLQCAVKDFANAWADEREAIRADGPSGHHVPHIVTGTAGGA